jgi:peptidoglycan biosynthesis protein MviN/MurJ (putative lipid II flippase)
MVLVWLLFTVVLFIAAPLFLDRWFAARARRAPEETFALVRRVHWVLLILSLITIVGAVAGSHGISFVG